MLVLFGCNARKENKWEAPNITLFNQCYLHLAQFFSLSMKTKSSFRKKTPSYLYLGTLAGYKDKQQHLFSLLRHNLVS